MVRKTEDIDELPKPINILLLIITLLSVATFLFIANPAKYYFLNDDFQHLALAAEGHFLFSTFLRPVGDLMNWIDFKFWGQNAFGYHLSCILIHLSNAVLVYLLAGSLFANYSNQGNVFLKSMAAALLFLIYAFHSEPLLWVICRSGSLATFFFLLACLCYLQRQKGINWFLFSLLFFGIGMFTYESTWVYPVVVILISLVEMIDRSEKLRKELYFLGIAVLFFILFLLYMKCRIGAIGNEYTIHNLTHFNPFRLLYNYNTLIARTFLPYMASSRLFLSFYLACVIGISMLVFLIRKRKRDSVLLYLLIACFLVSPLPVISLGISTHNSESERFIYLPSLFFILLLVELGSAVFPKLKLFIGALVVSLTFHGYFLIQSAFAYQMAGSIIHKSLNAIGEKRTVNRLYVFNLPIQYKGAIMFRAGFGDAIHWICRDLQYNQMDTMGSLTLNHPDAHFSIQQFDIKNGMLALHATTAEKQGREIQVQLNGYSFTFRKGQDMLLYWTDSSMVKIN